MITVKEAKETTVFIPNNEKYLIESFNLFELVNNYVHNFCDEKYLSHVFVEDKGDNFFDIRKWNYDSKDERKFYLSQEQVDEEIFNCKLENCFQFEYIFYTKEEAFDFMCETYSGDNYLDLEVSISILRKREIIQKKRAEIKAVEDAISREKYKAQNKINDELALVYAKAFDRIEGESYKETAKRLSDTLTSRLDSQVFHKAVKLIRK